MRGNRVSWAALLVAIAALLAAISGVATGLTGRNSVDRNDLEKGAVQFSDLSASAKKKLRRPTASAVITGFGANVEVTDTRGMGPANVFTNNGRWCIVELGFTPGLAQAHMLSDHFHNLETGITSAPSDACGQYPSAVEVQSTASYEERFRISIYR